MKKIRWTDEEEQTVVNALEVYMNAKKPFDIAFEEITKFLEGRTAGAISYHWKHVLAPKHPEIKDLSEKTPKGKKNAWNDDEDLIVVEKVLDKISTGGKIEDVYEEIHDTELPGRTTSAIRFRWQNELRKRFDVEYKEAHEKRKALLHEAVQQGIEFSELQVNDSEADNDTEAVNTSVGYLALVEEEEIHKVAEELNNEPVVEEEVTKSNWTVELQETQHLSNFLNNVTGVVEERNQLREENQSLRQQNQRLNARLKEQEHDYEMMEAKYREVMVMISKVQELMNEQSAGSDTAKDIESLKLKMERNGNLIRIM